MKIVIGYWLRGWHTSYSSNYTEYLAYNGYYASSEDGTSTSFGVRPIVSLPASLKGIVNDQVTISDI